MTMDKISNNWSQYIYNVFGIKFTSLHLPIWASRGDQHPRREP